MTPQRKQEKRHEHPLRRQGGDRDRRGRRLGRSHALELAARGAKVVVNDLGGARDGRALRRRGRGVVREIRAAGGEAIANGANVADFAEVQAWCSQAMDAWGRVDILVNNAGILRDKSFAKMELEDFARWSTCT